MNFKIELLNTEAKIVKSYDPSVRIKEGVISLRGVITESGV